MGKLTEGFQDLHLKAYSIYLQVKTKYIPAFSFSMRSVLDKFSVLFPGKLARAKVMSTESQENKTLINNVMAEI